MQKLTKRAPRLIRVSTTRLDGGVVFGSTPKVRWEPFAAPDRQNRVALGNYSMLIDHPDGWILVNTGPGDKAPLDLSVAPVRSRSCLLRELRDMCLAPKDISMVVLTHLHDEYAGGATHMTSSGRVVPTFSGARYIVQQAAYDVASAPSERSRRLYREDDILPLQESAQLELVDGVTEVAKGVWVEPAPGPTPGHQIVRVLQDGSEFVFIGLLAPTAMHLHPAVTMASDWDPDATMMSKREVLARAARADARIAPVGCDDWVLAREVVPVSERDVAVELPDFQLPGVEALAATG